MAGKPKNVCLLSRHSMTSRPITPMCKFCVFNRSDGIANWTMGLVRHCTCSACPPFARASSRGTRGDRETKPIRLTLPRFVPRFVPRSVPRFCAGCRRTTAHVHALQKPDSPKKKGVRWKLCRCTLAVRKIKHMLSAAHRKRASRGMCR